MTRRGICCECSALSVDDDQIMRALHDARTAGIPSADRIDRVMLAGERICIAGTVPGFRSMTDISERAPSLEQGARELQALNQQQSQEAVVEFQARKV